MSPFRRFAVGAAAAVVLVMTSVVPASAHDDLLSSTPSADERLDVSPSSVALEFSAELMDVGALIMVADADGRDWTAAEATVEATTVSAPFAEELPVGGYEVRWRVVSSDGHPISGVIPFTVGDAEPLQRAIPGDGETTPSNASSAPEQEGQNTQENEGVLRVVLIGAGGAAVAIAALAVFSFFRRRRSAGDSDEEAVEPSSKTP